jgi:membrane associated rhomboid family serine protease
VFPFKDNIPNDRPPVVTLLLIVANFVVYVVRPDNLAPLPSIFLQASVLQLLGNMWFLWIFGNTIEDAMGSLKFLVFYLAAGAIAVGIQGVVSDQTALGAGGAIAAVLGGYTVIHHRGRVITLILIPLLFTVAEAPAVILLGLWFVMQAAFAATGWIDWWAFGIQFGTFALGALSIRVLATRRKPTPPTRVVA